MTCNKYIFKRLHLKKSSGKSNFSHLYCLDLNIFYYELPLTKYKITKYFYSCKIYSFKHVVRDNAQGQLI